MSVHGGIEDGRRSGFRSSAQDMSVNERISRTGAGTCLTPGNGGSFNDAGGRKDDGIGAQRGDDRGGDRLPAIDRQAACRRFDHRQIGVNRRPETGVVNGGRAWSVMSSCGRCTRHPTNGAAGISDWVASH